MKSLFAVVLSLSFSATVSAQVLDDDLEFENHVATIELDEDSPVLEGIGLSREITYEAHFEGMPLTDQELAQEAQLALLICLDRL